MPLALACALSWLRKIYLSWHVCPLQYLWICFNQIGDAGVTALADVCDKGAMPSLNKLIVGEKKRNSPLKAACSKRGIYLV